MISSSPRKLRKDQAAGFAPLEREGWTSERWDAYRRTLEAAVAVKAIQARAAARRAEITVAALHTFDHAPAARRPVRPFGPRRQAPRDRSARAVSRRQRVWDADSRERQNRQTRLLASDQPSETHARVAAVVASWRAEGPELIPPSQLLRVLVSSAKADRTLAIRRLQRRCLAVLPVEHPDRKLAANWRSVATCFKDAAAPAPDLGTLAVPAGYSRHLEGTNPGRLMLDVVEGRRALLALTAPGARWAWQEGPLVEALHLASPLLTRAAWPSWYPDAAPAEWPLLAALAPLSYDVDAGMLSAR